MEGYQEKIQYLWQYRKNNDKFEVIKLIGFSQKLDFLKENIGSTTKRKQKIADRLRNIVAVSACFY